MPTALLVLFASCFDVLWPVAVQLLQHASLSFLFDRPGFVAVVSAMDSLLL